MAMRSGLARLTMSDGPSWNWRFDPVCEHYVVSSGEGPELPAIVESGAWTTEAGGDIKYHVAIGPAPGAPPIGQRYDTLPEAKQAVEAWLLTVPDVWQHRDEEDAGT